jgi:hypothetical protein
MKLTDFPSAAESIRATVVLGIFGVLTALFADFRLEHALLILCGFILFFAGRPSRKLLVGLLPLILFGVSYDWMRIYPNYMVNPVDVEALYNLELTLFGVVEDGRRMILSEFFAARHHPAVDLLTGIFYLGWVPLPVAFALYLYRKKKREAFLCFSIVFLLTNLLGFIGYYLHPAAPPWYAMQYGFRPVPDTPGHPAGLARFDALVHIPIFHSIYGRNSNVFAAVPSLHSAYLIVALFYALKNRCRAAIVIPLAVFMCGIWFTAVYTAHHYVIDVLLGIFCALAAILMFELLCMRLPAFRRFLRRYLKYITHVT